MNLASSLHEMSSEKLAIAGVCVALLFFVLLKIGLGIVKNIILLAIVLGVVGFFLFGHG